MNSGLLSCLRQNQTALMLRTPICLSSAHPARCSWVCQCFSRWGLACPGMWSMEYPDRGQAGVTFLVQIFWIHSCGNQLWGQLMHETLGDKTWEGQQLPWVATFWHKNYHSFLCSLERDRLKSKHMKQSKNNACFRDNEIWILFLFFQGQGQTGLAIAAYGLSYLLFPFQN